MMAHQCLWNIFKKIAWPLICCPWLVALWPPSFWDFLSSFCWKFSLPLFWVKSPFLSLLGFCASEDAQFSETPYAHMWAGYKILSFQSFFFWDSGGFLHIILVSAAPLETFGFVLAPRLSSPDISRALLLPQVTYALWCAFCCAAFRIHFPEWLMYPCDVFSPRRFPYFLCFFWGGEGEWWDFHYFTVLLDFENCSFCIFTEHMDSDFCCALFKTWASLVA